jgi:DNA-binding CsgD family transcriptional regulator
MGDALKRPRKSSKLDGVWKSPLQVRPESFVFLERRSGAVQFQIVAEEDGRMPEEQASSMLAMHCLVRGLTPEDFSVLVVPRKKLLNRVGSLARQLLAAGQAIACPVDLTRRQQEVLRGVLQNCSNKEIAAGLNLSERTVKFYVSALLAKFHVQGRVGLMREAGRVLLSGNMRDAPIEFPTSQAKPKGGAASESRERLFDWASNGGLPMQARKPLLA